MRRLQHFIETHSSIVMLIGGSLGLLFPFGRILPDTTIVCLTASVIFFSCFRLNAPIGSVLTIRNALFLIGRFALFPLVFWLAMRAVLPSYATALLLMALCPVAAASPALTGLYGGNVTQTFALTIVSHLACVVLIPFMLSVTGTSGVHIPAGHIFETLTFIILLPCVLFYFVRGKRAVSRFGADYGRLITVILVTSIVFVILAKKRSYFFAHPEAVPVPLLLDIGFYILTLFMVFPMRGRRMDRISYIVSSGLNNVAIGAGLSFLYFDTRTVTLFVCGEFAWCLFPFVAEYVTRRLPADGD